MPHPAYFVDPNWDEKEKQAVENHLRRTEFTPGMYMGHSYCRICEIQDNGCREKCDGTYLWPEGFLHYVTEHNVKPPLEFIEHCLSGPSTVLIEGDEEIDVDEEWWTNQRGHDFNSDLEFNDPFLDTYPKTYEMALKPFDRKELKSEFRTYLKIAGNCFGMTAVRLYTELTQNESILINEDVYEALQKASGTEHFLELSPID